MWLSVLGAVIGDAAQCTYAAHGIHQPLPGRRLRQKIEVIILLVVAAFVLILAYPAIEYSIDEAIVQNAWSRHQQFVAGLRGGGGGGVDRRLLAAAAAGHLSEPQFLTVTAAIFVARMRALWLARPLFMGLGNYNLLIFFVLGVGVAVAMGVPIAFAFGIATAGYVALATRAPLTVIVSRMDEGMSHLLLLSIPLFVLLGILIDMTGMARAMVGFLASLLGHVRGGLSYVLLGAMYLVSGISGAKAADMAAVAPVLFPEMKARGMKPGELVSLLAASGAMAETIPPSVVLIVIGSVASVSIAALFTGGLLPAAVLALALAIVAYFRSGDDDLVVQETRDGSEIGRAFVISVPALILPFIIRAAVVEGVATAVEVSTIGIAYTIAVGILIYRQFDWRRIWPMLIDTVSLVGRDPVHCRHRDCNGLGPHAVGLLPHACGHNGQGAGRRSRVYGLDHRGFHRSRQRSGGSAGTRAACPLAVPDRSDNGDPRRALFDGGHSRYGCGAVCTAVRRRIFHRLRDRQCRSR